MMTQHHDPDPVMLEIEGKQEPAYTMADAAMYLGISQTSLYNLLRRNAKIKKHQLGFGKERYLLKRDLDDLLRARPSES